ncbi:putative Tyrosine kinase-like (TKL) protein [Balamuthia mandrillaris]
MEGSKEIEELNKKFAEYEGEYSEKEKNLGFELIDPNSLSFESFLGDGTSALVYKGMYKDKKVAIKVLKDSITPQLFSDFKKELRVMSRVRGDMIVGFYGICLRPKFCVLMEYCANGSLFHLMKNPDVRFDWDLTFNLAQQILEALAFLHDSEPQIVHRDLKSLNILITDTYQVKLCDFGLSRQTSRDSKHSDGSQINNTFSTLYNCRGTYVYTAPEVYFKEKMYTDKSDVFSLGVILWELLMRCLTGEYVRPYSEHKNIIMDYQV